MLELEASVQEYAEFLVKARLVREKTARYCVRWVRGFLNRPASPEPLADQVLRFLAYVGQRQQVPASTQNQALCAVFFLCREVLGLDVEGLTVTARAKRGPHLPVVPERAGDGGPPGCHARRDLADSRACTFS